MDESLESKKQSGTANKTVIIAVIVVLLAAIAVLAFFLLRRDNKNVIGYATEARVMLDQESLQAAMDEARRNAAGNSVGLRYQNDAYSEDGTTFTCRIINSEVNLYDMFLTIFADAELTDQIFLSGLVPPGSGFESITLDHALDPGDHTVYVAVTQVTNDEETGEQVIRRQVMHTMEFHVAE